MVVICKHCRGMLHTPLLIDVETATELQKASASVELGRTLAAHFQREHPEVWIQVHAASIILRDMLLSGQVVHTGPDLPMLRAMAREHVLGAMDSAAAGSVVEGVAVELPATAAEGMAA